MNGLGPERCVEDGAHHPHGLLGALCGTESDEGVKPSIDLRARRLNVVHLTFAGALRRGDRPTLFHPKNLAKPLPRGKTFSSFSPFLLHDLGASND